MKSGSDEDKVINTGFALRRKGEPAWQCTTTHRRKTVGAAEGEG
jgi:hypothetical protein